ncbi:kinase-like protein [Rhizopogon salebrosus TDB-379]|nr:kinase-like protein [Rhizopogon salebrosus TDB-379]
MLRPREHPDHLLSILNLCQALHHRHSHRKSGADLREAAGLYHCLLPLCVEGSHLQLYAIEQCNALPMDPSDMSIALRRTVLEHCSLWPQHRARSLNRLAGDLHARFTQSCNIDHIHEAVDLSREALDICPDDGQRGFFFDVLSYYTFEWFRHRGYSRDECISLNRGGALRTHDRPDRRITPLNTLPDALITRYNHYNNIDHKGANQFHQEARDPRSNGLSTSLPPSRHSEERHYAGRGQPTRIHQQPSLNSSLSNRRIRRQIPNLAIFGDSTSGERSVINVIAHYQLGKTSSDAAGCISRYQRHEAVKLPGERFDLFYTAAQSQDIIPHLNQTGECGEDNAPISNQPDSLGMAPAEEQVNRESTGSVSDLLPDLTNELQGRSSYVVASGGFGDIWQCVLVQPSRIVRVAAKTIRVTESDSDAEMSRKAEKLRRELKVWSRLRHECILPLWGVAYNFGPYPAMICPWVDDGALTGFLTRRQDTLSCQDKFSLLNDIALGLQYLHSKLIVHGDLTGSNILVHSDGRACLADFGLSTILLEFEGPSYLTSSIGGNVRWAAAELFEVPDNSKESKAAVSLSTECDIYSFGSITLQVLTYKVPYYNLHRDDVVLGQVIRGIKPVPPMESRMTPMQWEFIQRCWLPRANRPSMGEIAEFVTLHHGPA